MRQPFGKLRVGLSSVEGQQAPPKADQPLAETVKSFSHASCLPPHAFFTLSSAPGLLSGDCVSRVFDNGPAKVKYCVPATRSFSEGKRVITSQPSLVTTTSSSRRAADQPSVAGQ